MVEIATKPLSHLLGTDFSFFEIIEKNLRINNRLSIICCIFVTVKNKILNKNSTICYECKIKSFFWIIQLFEWKIFYLQWFSVIIGQIQAWIVTSQAENGEGERCTDIGFQSGEILHPWRYHDWEKRHQHGRYQQSLWPCRSEVCTWILLFDKWFFGEDFIKKVRSIKDGAIHVITLLRNVR